jgi:hypothetical protein
MLFQQAAVAALAAQAMLRPLAVQVVVVPQSPQAVLHDLVQAELQIKV